MALTIPLNQIHNIIAIANAPMLYESGGHASAYLYYI